MTSGSNQLRKWVCTYYYFLSALQSCFAQASQLILLPGALCAERVKRLSPSVYECILCVVKEHDCLLSYHLKIATKWLSTAHFHNSYSSKDA